MLERGSQLLAQIQGGIFGRLNDEWNLQIQVNYKPKITSLNELAPDTVAGPVLVSKAAPLTADQIRAAFKASPRI
ncbi:hypothetical protein CMUS01_12301 [Colletotrichum musicola]|uniref:Uncharacterized protein n=1 Tax=Colletotrichum musicola TaxID=2175873 RepID=A0A8H6JN35_9PEZI|nr:hypothetical protein CMUS01_12301 [Colletotrichum musicola]